VFHVKVCGVTRPADGRAAAEAGADAIGLNFVAGSPRRIEPATAAEIVRSLPPGVLVVGVFAGSRPEEILRIAGAVGLGAVQLHGQLFHGTAADPPATCAALGGLAVIRAVRLGPGGLEPARRWLAAARLLGGSPRMALADAAVRHDTPAGLLGGRGERVDWQTLAAAGPLDVPLGVAGGLDAANVARAVQESGAVAVDVASGVEREPGLKDRRLLEAFVREARRALGLPPAGPGQ